MKALTSFQRRRKINSKRKQRFSEPLEPRRMLAGDLLAHWLAEDLNATVEDGQPISAWVDSTGNISATPTGLPTLAKNAVGGRSSVRLDASDGADYFSILLADNPINSLDDFSVTVAFETSSDELRGDTGNWYDATGLVDANTRGFAQDWGVVINGAGQVGAGLGDAFGAAPTSLYTSQTGFNNGELQIATFTRSDGQMSIYMNDDPADVRSDGSVKTRSRVTMAFGALSDGSGAFTGDITEIRLFSGQLTSDEVGDLHREIRSYYNNGAPIAVNDAYETVEDGFFLLVAAANGVLANDSDPEGDPLTATLVEGPQNGALTLREDGSFIYDPERNFFGIDQFTYVANDFRPSEPATVVVTVAPSYDAVETTEDSYKLVPSQRFSVDAAGGVLSNDVNVDQSPLTASVVSDNTPGNLFLAADGSFTYDPLGVAGIYTFSYQVFDTVNQSAPQTVTLVINSPPVIADDNLSVEEDQRLIASANTGVLANDRDSEGDEIIATLIETTVNGTLIFAEDGSYEYEPNADFFGSDRFNYQISDGIDDSSIATASIIVMPVNDAPVARPDLVVTFVNESKQVSADLGILANDFDIDSEALTVSLVTTSEHGTLQLQPDGSLSYTPQKDYIGVDSFRYQVSDGLLESEVTTVSVVVASKDQQVVINEVHYDPPDNTVPAEFIELVNQGSTPVDVSNWYFSDGVNYVIPQGSVILPGEYLVVSQDPATITSLFEVGSIGPWSGRLSSDGERIVLRSAEQEIVDEVDYVQGFPWPIASGGEGPSMELINPTLDNDLGGSWRAGLEPTPGKVNSIFSVNAAPQIRQVDHTPEQPAGGETTTITAKVTDLNGVKSVELQYQVVAPGNFIPAVIPFTPSELRRNAETPRPVNPEYYDAANWTTVTMVDDGTAGDAMAADDIYSVAIPGQTHRSLVRYRIIVTDGVDLAQQVPYEDDAALNFAYFVYDGIPEFNGHSKETLESLPTYHVIARAEDVEDVMAYRGADQITQGTLARFTYNWPAAFVYNGKVYDNINFRLRGANGRYHNAGKRSMRFRFNDGSYMQAHDQEGNPFAEKWRTLTTGKMFDNRGTLTYSLNEAINYELYNTIGLPATNTFYAQMRVIDDAAEAPDQWTGDYWGLTYILETYDVRFLDSHGLERGNLYKLINQTRSSEQQQRYQAPNAVSDGSDHDNIERNLIGSSTAEYIDAHVNLEKYYLFHALAEAIRHYDYWPDANKNMVYYFEPDYLPENDNLGKLWILPWDTDASWGPTWNEGHDVVYNSLFAANGGGSDRNETPELWPAYFNVVREIRDLVWQEDQIYPLLEELADVIRPLEQADADRWNGGPNEAGSYRGIGGAGVNGIDALVQDMKNFAFSGGSWPGGTVRNGGRAADLDRLQSSRGEGDEIPKTPTITYSGAAGFAANGLRFRTSDFVDPQGNDSFAAIEWRVAEITDPNSPAFDPNEKFKLEWNSSWVSGERTEFTNEIAPPSTAVEAGHTYRARVRMQDNTGRWSHWSAPVQFTATAATSSVLVDALRVSELHYHPADPNQQEVTAGFSDSDDFEFIEIVNISAAAVDLSGAQFVETEIAGERQGIEFRFSDGDVLTLGAGERVLIVEDIAAFTMRYGDGFSIAGQWSGSLSNGGETLRLLGDGFTIQEFAYDDAWYPTTDGAGNSLQIVNETGSIDAWSQQAGWRASNAIGGSPGVSSGRLAGDSNGDGIFSSSDLVVVFQAGEYEDAIAGNSTFEEGDWNGDGDFTSRDLVFAFTNSVYSTAAVPVLIGAAIDRGRKDPVRQNASDSKSNAAAQLPPRPRLIELQDRDLVFEEIAKGKEPITPRAE